MLQRKLLKKPCFNFLKSDNNLLKSDFSATKQGFIFTKHNNVKIKQYKRTLKLRFPPCETSFNFDKIVFKF